MVIKAMLGHSYFHWTTNMKYTVALLKQDRTQMGECEAACTQITCSGGDMPSSGISEVQLTSCRDYWV